LEKAVEDRCYDMGRAVVGWRGNPWRRFASDRFASVMVLRFCRNNRLGNTEKIKRVVIK